MQPPQKPLVLALGTGCGRWLMTTEWAFGGADILNPFAGLSIDEADSVVGSRAAAAQPDIAGHVKPPIFGVRRSPFGLQVERGI
jgi:hypothetical protein